MKKNQDNTGREVIFNMKKGEDLRSCTYAVLILISALAFVMLLIQSPAHGAVTCSTKMSTTTDSDGDGFTDYQECYGITAPVSFPGKTSEQARANRLDPDSKDLFVIVVPYSGGYFNQYFQSPYMDALEFVTKPITGLGDKVTVHPLTTDLTNRYVTNSPFPGQKAIRVAESLDMSDPLTLGISNYGTPNKLDFATVFTKRIVQFIDSQCAGANACVDSTGISNRDELKKKYIKHVIAHEVGHVVSLTNVSNANFGGYHYQTGTNVLLDQSVYYTNKSGTVTYYIGTNYTTNDQSVFKVK